MNKSFILKHYKKIATVAVYGGLYLLFGIGACAVFFGLHALVWGALHSSCDPFA